MTATLQRDAKKNSHVSSPQTAETTLYLSGFDVACGGNGDKHCKYRANVALSVNMLDSQGFVTDNHSFIESMATVDATSPEDIGKAITDLAKQRIGDRLIRIEGQVFSKGKNPTRFQWPSEQPVARKRQASGTVLGIHDFPVEASLADNAVCGGYAGEFMCKMKLTFKATRTKKSPKATKVTKAIRQSFAQGMFKASCEELTMGAIAVACRLGGENLLGVTAVVYNQTGFAETTWSTGMAVPAFPRKATAEEERQTSHNSQHAYQMVSWC